MVRHCSSEKKGLTQQRAGDQASGERFARLDSLNPSNPYQSHTGLSTKVRQSAHAAPSLPPVSERESVARLDVRRGVLHDAEVVTSRVV